MGTGVRSVPVCLYSHHDVIKKDIFGLTITGVVRHHRGHSGAFSLIGAVLIFEYGDTAMLASVIIKFRAFQINGDRQSFYDNLIGRRRDYIVVIGIIVTEGV